MSRVAPWLVVLGLVPGCGHAAAPPATAAKPIPKANAHELVLEAASCWMGGLWSDAVGEKGNERTTGIEARCDGVLHDASLAAAPRAAGRRGVTERMPGEEPGYFPLRAVEPGVVDAIAREVRVRAAHDPVLAADTPDLVELLRVTAAAARETTDARRAADTVKDDNTAHAGPDVRSADRTAAAPKLRESDALDALLRAQPGRYAAEARVLGLLSALDRVEIARKLPKHLKVYVVAGAFNDVFGVPPPAVSDDAAGPIDAGTWLDYLTTAAAAAGHPVPDEARYPQDREPLAWTGVLEGFADRLREQTASLTPDDPLQDVDRSVVRRLDREYAGEREAFKADAAVDQ